MNFAAEETKLFEVMLLKPSSDNKSWMAQLKDLSKFDKFERINLWESIGKSCLVLVNPISIDHALNIPSDNPFLVVPATSEGVVPHSIRRGRRGIQESILYSALNLNPFIFKQEDLKFFGSEANPKMKFRIAPCPIQEMFKSAWNERSIYSNYKRNIPIYLPVFPLIIDFRFVHYQLDGSTAFDGAENFFTSHSINNYQSNAVKINYPPEICPVDEEENSDCELNDLEISVSDIQVHSKNEMSKVKKNKKRVTFVQSNEPTKAFGQKNSANLLKNSILNEKTTIDNSKDLTAIVNYNDESSVDFNEECYMLCRYEDYTKINDSDSSDDATQWYTMENHERNKLIKDIKDFQKKVKLKRKSINNDVLPAENNSLLYTDSENEKKSDCSKEEGYGSETNDCYIPSY